MPQSLEFMSLRTPPILLADRVGVFLLTLSFIQKGKQRDNKAAERNQQSQDTKDYHYDFVSRHTHHLPSYVFPCGSRLRGSHSCHRCFPTIYSTMRTYVFQ